MRASVVESDLACESDAMLLAWSAEQPECFGVLFDRYAEQIFEFLAAKTHCRAIAADLTAEAFAAAFIGRGRFVASGEHTARPWLFGVARRKLWHWYRSKAVEKRARLRLQMAHVEYVESESANVMSAYERIHDRSALEELLGSVPNSLAAAVVMRYYYDTSYEDIAAALSCTPGAARVRVTRGLALLRRQVKESA